MARTVTRKTSPATSTKSKKPSVQDRLLDAGRRRAQAEQQREEAMADIATLAREAMDAGVSVSHIARLTGVTRGTVYSLTAEPLV